MLTGTRSIPSARPFLIGLGIALGLAVPVGEVRGAEIHLEQSFRAARKGGGSSWGTDDAFRRALDLPRDSVPELYRLPLIPAEAPVFADVSRAPSAEGRFLDSKAVLYPHVRVCLDESLPAPDAALEEAKELFLDQLAGRERTARLFRMTFERVREGTGQSLLGRCDVLARQGRWSEFPYRHLADGPGDPGQPWLSRVFGVFFRWDDDSLPVVTFHPEVEVSYSPLGGRYLSVARGGRLRIDGRVVLMHEIGHVLGLSHLSNHNALFDHPELTAMGIEMGERDERALRLRFEFGQNLWKRWDAYQTTIYRRVFARYLKAECGMPPRSVLTQGPLLDEVERLNRRLEEQKPWGAFPVTVEMVRDAIDEEAYRLTPEVCELATRIYRGGWVAWNEGSFTGARLWEHLSEGPCEDENPPGRLCRRFRVWLSIKGTRSQGYGFEVGKDVVEK